MSAPAPIPWTVAYRLRWKRRDLLWQAWRSRHALTSTTDNTAQIARDAILCVMCVRNEALRLPFFLDHHRRLGVDHFLVVDNGSEDGTLDLLTGSGDVSVWRTDASYRAARFGLDWMAWLQRRYAHGHWCLMLDADELLTYDGCDSHGLRALCDLLDRSGQRGFGALMVELYPDGPLGQGNVAPGQDPGEVLPYFDAGPYRTARQSPRSNLWVQGGPRDRVFFADQPERAPTLNKLPLMRWDRRWAYTNSCHALLPRELNHLYDGPGGAAPSGALLHTKFLPDVGQRSKIEKGRRQHFHTPEQMDGYYDALTEGPNLMGPESRRYGGPDSLIEAGLMPRIPWP